MTSLEYHRPQTLAEALDLLKHGVPLAGGTRLTPSLRGIETLVDLQDLGLDQVEVSKDQIVVGGTASLQGMVDHAEQLPGALMQAARLEAGWNIRNKATVAGTIVTGDGRSPLLTVLLAMGADINFAPGDERVSLQEMLNRGSDRTAGKLITAIHTAIPESLKYAQVARSPADRPQLCVAVAKTAGQIRIALGGFGAGPQLLDAQEAEAAANQARAIYADAGDQWASAEYRSSAASVLVARLITEMESE
jgi:CO/xanthine dehydrogenase FAD-binding subunit